MAASRAARIGAGFTFGVVVLAFFAWGFGTAGTPFQSGPDEVVTSFTDQDAPTQNVTVRGTVDTLSTDFFGRPSKVAIVSFDEGLLVETAIEDEGAGEDLKDHVGKDVTATGLVKLKFDGTAAFVVSRFEVNGERPALFSSLN